MTSASLRILHLADAVFEEKAGGSRQVARELMIAQTNAGHDVTILVARQSQGIPQKWRDERGIVCQYAKGANPREWIDNSQKACEQLLAENVNAAFDVVHTHFAYAAVGPLRALGRHIPRVRTFHGPWDAEGFIEDTANAGRNLLYWLKAIVKRKTRYLIERDNLHQSRAIITLSQVFRADLIRFGIEPDLATIIPGGVNRDRFFVDTDDPQARAKARVRAGLPGDAFPLLLSVRRLVPRMGLENLVAAIPAIRARFPGVKLVIGGRGALKETLEVQAKALGVADVVTLAGFIPDDKIVDYYRGADAFVLPTLALEGFGLVTVEALACGTPVIGTPTGATPELLADLDKRLLTKGVEPTHLADAITAFCAARQQPGGWATPLSAKHLGDYVDARYTWRRHADGVEQVYRQAIGSPQAEKGNS